MSPSELSWLHLSDFHSGLEDHGTDRTRLIDLFLKDLEDVLVEAGPVDLVPFTGDLTQSGKPEEFQRLDREVLDPLWTILSNNPPLLAVPGNHDLERPSGSIDKKTAEALPRDPALLEELWSGSGQTYKFVCDCFAAYQAWWQNHPRRPRDHYSNGLLPGDFAYLHEKNGVRYGIAGLNTAALHLRDVKEGDLRVDKRQLVPAAFGSEVSKWLQNCRLGLLLTHHPSGWLDKQNYRESFTGGLNAHEFHFHLFGHMHEPAAEQVERGGGNLPGSLQASSLFGLEQYIVLEEGGNFQKRKQRTFGYTVGRIESDGTGSRLRLWPRRAERGQDGRWRFGSDRTYVLARDVLAAERSVPHALRGPAPAVSALPAPTVATAPAPSGLAAPTIFARPVMSWTENVAAHPLWEKGLGPEREAWRRRARAVVGQCEAAENDATIKGDPWRDRRYPSRVLDRLADMELAGDELTPAQVMLLVTAPFVHVAIWAQGLAWVCGGGKFDDFGGHVGAEEPRATLERAHLAFPQVVRRAERLTNPAERRPLAFWLAHRALDHLPQIWEPHVATPLGPLHETLRQKAGEAHEPLMHLVRCVGGGIARIDGEQGLVRELDRVLGSAPISQARLGALLTAASAAALDVRAVDELALHHVGGPEGFTIASLVQAVNDGQWHRSGDARLFSLQCREPVQHFCVTDLVQRADSLTKDLRALRDGLGRGLPSELSAREVIPEVNDAGARCFRPIHIRFRLDHHRIRDLLMGQTLYAEPTLALRELYQNALDACRYRRARTEYLQRQPNSLGVAPYEGKIVFRQRTIADGRRVIECEDNGVGMTEHVLAHVFSVAGRRFHDEPTFLEELGRWKRAGIEFHPNSQHGIGVLSYFMLADEIEVETRSYGADGRKGAPLRVRISTVSGLFQPVDADEDFECGTRVRLYLDKRIPEDHQHTTSGISVANVLRKLLVIAEFATEVYEDVLAPDGMRLAGTPAHRWEPGVPDLRQSWSASSDALCATDLPDVWWSDDSECPVLADGIRIQETFPFALVNLRGSHYPRLSADRQRIVGEWDQKRVIQCLERSMVRLIELETLSLVLLYQIFTTYPDALAHWEEIVHRRDIVRFFSGPEVRTPMAIIRTFEACDGMLPERVSLKRVGWMPSDMALLSAPSEAPVQAFAAWRCSVWEGALGRDWPRLYARNPRLDQGTQPPVLELALCFVDEGAHGLFSGFPTGSPRNVEALVFGPESSRRSRLQSIRALHWAEVCLGLPMVGLAEWMRRAVQDGTIESSLPLLDEIDQHLLSVIRQGPSAFSRLMDADASVLDRLRGLSPEEIFARLRKLASLWNLESMTDPEELTGIQLDGQETQLFERYISERWTGKVVPATHVLYAARDLKMGVAEVATSWIKLAPHLGLELGFEVDTLLRVKPDQRDWQLLSHDLDGALRENDWSTSLAFGSEMPAPWLFGSVPGAHVLYASRVLRIPAGEVIDRLRELATPLRLILQFNADAVTAIDLSKQDWRLLSQRLSGYWPWLSEVPAAHVVAATHTGEWQIAAAVARLAELAAPMGVTLRPCVSFLREQAFEALVQEVAERSAPVPYDDFDARRCTERWVLQAGVNVNDGVNDPERALLCAGRWWLWWLTDETLREIGSTLLLAVIAEKERGPVR